MDTFSCSAIIPARGGSKGIPRKNLRRLGSKPLVAWSIDAAREAHCVHRVVVSTDDAEIGAVAREHGAQVVWRPGEISGDLASSESALLHALGHLGEAENYQPDLLVFLQCTAPLTTSQDIDGTVQALLDAQADTALAVQAFHYFVWRYSAEGDAVGVNHDKRVRLLRQQREDEFLETGAVYAMRTQGFLEHRHRFFGKTAMYAMPPERCHEIDEEGDIAVVEALLRGQERNEPAAVRVDHIRAVVLDFDGVLTDNRVYVDQDGGEAVACNRADGWGISLLRQAGYRVLCLSTESNPVVAARCRKLGIECLQNQDAKWTTLSSYLEASGIAPETVVYVGNDTNDLECLQHVGLPIAVADAHASAKHAATYVTHARGGAGAAREVADLLLGPRSTRTQF